jgi:hypothetical protein
MASSVASRIDAGNTGGVQTAQARREHQLQTATMALAHQVTFRPRKSSAWWLSGWLI